METSNYCIKHKQRAVLVLMVLIEKDTFPCVLSLSSSFLCIVSRVTGALMSRFQSVTPSTTWWISYHLLPHTREVYVVFTVKNAGNKHVYFVTSAQNLSCNSEYLITSCMKRGRDVYLYQTLWINSYMYYQYIIQNMHFVTRHLCHISTPTYFDTDVPSSVSHYNKGI